MTSFVGDTKLEGADIGVLVSYFVIVIGFGLWVSLNICASINNQSAFLHGRKLNQ